MARTNIKQQHVDIHRKLALRKQLMEKGGELKGAFYIPFIGDGNIAQAIYQGKRIFGADLDGDRVKTAKGRFPNDEIIQANCDAFPFAGKDTEYSLADFDAYAYPYKAFREFWSQAKITSPCVLFFTDGEKQAIICNGHWTAPDGKKTFTQGLDARRVIFHKYWLSTILPWFEEYIKPWKVVDTAKYLRGDEFYWGAVIEHPEVVAKVAAPGKKQSPHRNIFDNLKKEKYLQLLQEGKGRGVAASMVGVHRATVSLHMQKEPEFEKAASEAEMLANEKVESSLYEAALSGNVTAIQVWLYNRMAEKWADRRSVKQEITGPEGKPLIPPSVEFHFADGTVLLPPRNGQKEIAGVIVTGDDGDGHHPPEG